MSEYFSDTARDPIEKFTWQFILCEEKGDTLSILLNNPARRNALNPIMLNELAYALAYADQKPSIRFARLRGEGPVFCAGADLRSTLEGIESTSTVPQAAKPIILDELFSAFRKPLVIELDGDVIAGGLLLVTGATFVVAHSGVRFSLPEVRRGLFPFQVMKALSTFMPARVALNWCLTGEEKTAAELYAYGLISYLVQKPEEVAPKADSLVETLREGAPLAMQYGIRAYRELGSLSHAQLHALLLDLMQTEDAREGILAFKEKRKAQWKGR
ncbi:MAG: enoyl-CoA hydratase-related protein [Bacteroidia bacterium]|nr:enoyl-CoA hydratase-related protein [Bacteroidia bacterium]